MTMPFPPCPRPLRRLGAARTFALALAVGATLLAGCGDKKKDKAATQTAAKVNKEEITVHQINFVLPAAARPARPSRPRRRAAQVLERLIDQELALQKADGPEARPRPARRAADRGGAARDHRPRLPREDRRGRAQADAGGDQGLLRGAPGALQGTAHLQPPGGRRSRPRPSRSTLLRDKLRRGQDLRRTSSTT